MKEKERFSRDFMLVVIGQIISLFGNAVLRFALPLHLLNVSSSPALYGMVSALAFLPLLAISPIGGVIADRVNKRNIMVVLDFFTCGLLLLFLVLEKRVDMVLLILVTLLLLYSISALYQPSVQSSMPFLVSQEKLVTANAVINMVSSLAGLLGPVLGGICYSASGINLILIISAVCFFVSAVMEIFIRIPFTKRKEEKSVLKIVGGDLKESLHFILKEQKIVGRVTGVVAGINLFMSALMIIGLPVLCTQVLQFQKADANQMYGYLSGAMAVGGLLGGILAGAAGDKLKVEKGWILIFAGGTLLFPAGITLLITSGAAVQYGVLVAVSMGIMVMATMFTVLMMAFVQKITPPHMIGKVISWVLAISTCAQPVGQAFYGWIFEKMQGREGVIFCAAGLVCLVLSLYLKTILNEISD